VPGDGQRLRHPHDHDHDHNRHDDGLDDQFGSQVEAPQRASLDA
jgi:hypothetical protein